MYQYNFSDDDSKNAVKKISLGDDKLKELEDRIGKLKDRFDLSETTKEKLPENMDLEELPFQDKTDEEIETEAKSSLGEYYRQGKQNIEDEYRDTAKKYSDDIESLVENSKKAKENIANTYETAKQNASDDALKRGLARSSIVINRLDAFDQDMIDKYNKLDKELTNSIDAIDFEINGLEGKKNKALENFELDYADKLNQKISSLKDDLEKKRAEVTKYNNEIREKEKEYEAEISELARKMAVADDDRLADLLNYATKNGYTNYELFQREALYFVVDNYLQGLDADTVNYILDSKYMQDTLPESYISSLRAKYAE